jgi:hypothetical protein
MATAATSGRRRLGVDCSLGQLQLSPQIDPTSETQIESHFVLQQYESSEHSSVTHESQPLFSFLPVLHSECEHVPPLPPLHDSLQYWPTSPTQIESHAVVQQ